VRDNIADLDDADDHFFVVDHNKDGMTVTFKQPDTFRDGGVFLYGNVAPCHEVGGGTDISADKAVYTGGPFSAPDTHFGNDRENKVIGGDNPEEMPPAVCHNEVAAAP